MKAWWMFLTSTVNSNHLKNYEKTRPYSLHRTSGLILVLTNILFYDLFSKEGVGTAYN
jgi:hypothetical protein